MALIIQPWQKNLGSKPRIENHLAHVLWVSFVLPFWMPYLSPMPPNMQIVPPLYWVGLELAWWLALY